MILKLIDIDVADENIAILNKRDAFKLQVYSGERVLISNPENYRQKVVAVLDVLEKNITMPDGEVDLKRGEVGLFSEAYKTLGLVEGALVDIRPIQRPLSFEYVKAKAAGGQLTEPQLTAITRDIVDNVYSSADIAFFLAACTIRGMSLPETAAMCQAYVKSGTHYRFPRRTVVDKHCIGGIPGNRTTPIVVAIVAATGVVVPNNFTRSITSPAGTADVLENYLRVDLNDAQIRKTIAKTNACLVWGGSTNIAPADDIILEIEHPFNLDSENQMIAAILAKKIGAGNQSILIDIPVGPEAKVKTSEKAATLKQKFLTIGRLNKLNVKVLISDGTKPVGKGVGPILEMLDIIKVLKNEPDAPLDLREKSIMLAANLLLLAKKVPTVAAGKKLATDILSSGRAWKQLQLIRKTQGAVHNLDLGRYVETITAKRSGQITGISNKAVNHIAKLAGAPLSNGAGLYLRKQVGDAVQAGEPLYLIYAQHPTRLKFATQASKSHFVYLIK